MTEISISPVKATDGLIISTTLIPQITTRCFFTFTPFCMDELSLFYIRTLQGSRNSSKELNLVASYGNQGN